MEAPNDDLDKTTTMFSLYALIISLAYTQAIAVKILGPTSGSTWTSPGPNTIKWVNETYDPITFNIQLAHNNSTAFIPSLALPIDGIFATGVHITARMMVYVPSCAAGSPRLPTGEGFTIRFLQEARDGSETVIATSEVRVRTSFALGGRLSADSRSM